MNAQEERLRQAVQFTPEEQAHSDAIERLPGVRTELQNEIARARDPKIRDYLMAQLNTTPGDGAPVTASASPSDDGMIDISGPEWKPVNFAGGPTSSSTFSRNTPLTTDAGGMIDISGPEWRPVSFGIPAAPQEPEHHGVLKQAALSFGKGTGALVKGIGWLVGSDTVENFGAETEKLYSDWQNEDPETAKQLSAVADAKGFLNALKELGSNPRALSDFIVGAIPSMAPGMGAAGLAARASLAMKLTVNAARAAGVSEDVAATAGRMAAAKMAATGASATATGATFGSQAGADTEEFLLAHDPNMDPAQAKQVANETALKVGAATAVLSLIGRAPLEAKLASAGVEDAGLKGFAKNVGLTALEGAIQQPAQDYFTTEARQQVDPSAQFDLGKSVAMGIGPGVATGAGLHVFGRAKAMATGEEVKAPLPTDTPPPPAETPPPPATDHITDVDLNRTLQSLDAATTVEGAVVAAASTLTPIHIDTGTSLETLSRDQQLRTVADSDALRTHLDSLDPETRAATLQNLSNASNPNLPQDVRTQAVDSLHAQLDAAGVFHGYEQEQQAKALEGTPKDKDAIAKASALFESPEWQAYRDAQAGDVRASLLGVEEAVGNKSLPEAGRAEAAQVALTHAKENKLGEEVPKTSATLEKTEAAPAALEEQKTQIKALTDSPQWKNHVAGLDESTRAPLVKAIGEVGNPLLPASYRFKQASAVLDYAKNAGLTATKPEAIASKTGQEASTNSEPMGLPTLAPEHGTVTLVDPKTFTATGLGNPKTGQIGTGFARLIQAMGRALGRNVQFFEQSGHTTHLEGFAHPDDPSTIYLNRASSGKRAWQVVAGHEFLHTMPKDIKDAFLRAIEAEIPKEQYDALTEYINQPTLDRAGVVEEAGADLMGNRFNEPEFWSRVLGRIENPTMAQRVLQFVQKFIARLTAALGKGAGSYNTDQYVKNLENVRAAAVKAMQDYLAREHNGEGLIGGRLAGAFSVEELTKLSRSTGSVADKAKAEMTRRERDPDAELDQRLNDDMSDRPAYLSTKRKPDDILFEVAPDPNDKELAARWRDLPMADRFSISKMIADRMIPKVLAAIGVKGEVHIQLGGYMGETNPSFMIRLDKNSTAAQIDRAAKLTGFVLSQNEMMVVTDKAGVQNAAKKGVITVTLHDGATPSEVTALYKSLYEIDNGALQGHTTIADQMALVVDLHRLDDLAQQIDEKLNRQYPVDINEAFVSFIKKEEYDHASDTPSTGNTVPTGPSLRDAYDSYRAEATDLIRRELDRRELDRAGPEQLSTERGADGRDDRPSGRGAGEAGEQAQATVSIKPQQTEALVPPVVGIHYGKVGNLDTLNGDKYGTGISGAERKRLQWSKDPSIKRRVYFYPQTDPDVMPTKEGGLGNHVYTSKLGNLYDIDADPLGITQKIADIRNPDDRKNEMESMIVKAGYDGYATSHMMVALDGDVPVHYLGENATRNPKFSTERGEPMSFDEFAKDMKNRVQASVEYGRLLSKMHDWSFNVGDNLLSTKTGKVYELTGRSFQRVGKLSENKWEPVYSYKAGREGEDGYERGFFPEKNILESKTLKSLTTPKMSTERNLGELTPEQAEAVAHVLGKPATVRDKLNAFKADWKKNLVQGVFDHFAPLKELDPKAYMLARMSRGGDSTLESLLLYDKVVVDRDGFYDTQYKKENGLSGYATSLAKLQGEHDRFLLWVAAQRAEQLKAIGLENLFSDKDIAALKTLNQGTLPDGTTTRSLAYSKALKDTMEFNESVLKLAVDSGEISPETAELYRKNPHVPFYRLQTEGGMSAPQMKAGLVNQEAWKRLKGGTEKLREDLLANVLQNWSHLITSSAKNRAAKAALEAAEQMGIATRVPNGMPGKGLVAFKEGGVDHTYQVHDPHVLDALVGLEGASLGAWSKPFTAMKHWLTLGVTVNPAFKIRNLLRDSIASVAVSDLPYNPAGNIKRGWAATALESETRAHMLASGGMIRFGSMLDGNSAARAHDLIARSGVADHTILDSPNKVKGLTERIKTAFDAYQELGDRGEQINRAALYESLREKGMSHGEASYWARDLLDFSGSGKWAAIRTLTQTVPFMNARLQGLYKLGRASKEDLRRFGAVVGSVALASIGIMLAYKDDDDWKKREDWDRQNYWWFKVGDTAYRVPKPFEIGAIGTIAEMGLEYFGSNDMTGKRFLSNMGDLVGNQLNMNPVPQLVKPMMDVYANTDSFTQRPIETQAMRNLRPEDRYNPNTSQVARFLGGLGLPDPAQLAMGHYDPLSPVKIDVLAKGYFGWLGTMATTAIDYGVRPMIDEGDRPTMALRDVFLVGNFAESLPSGSSRYLTAMYQQAQEIEQAYASYSQALKSGDIAKAQSIAQEHGQELAQHGAASAVVREESQINVMIKQIMNSRTLSAETKRTAIDALNRQRDQVARAIRLP